MDYLLLLEIPSLALLSADDSSYKVNNTGGEASHTHSLNAHTHSLNEHTHTLVHTHSLNNHTHSTPNHTHTYSSGGSVGYAGTSGNVTDANMQPYIVVNRWHRVA